MQPFGKRQHLDLGHAVIDQRVAGDIEPVFAGDFDVARERFLFGI